VVFNARQRAAVGSKAEQWTGKASKCAMSIWPGACFVVLFSCEHLACQPESVEPFIFSPRARAAGLIYGPASTIFCCLTLFLTLLLSLA
jgi:hypothetical protein